MTNENNVITIDGVEYEADKMSENAKSQIINIQFVDEELQRLQNELAVSDTARMAYEGAMKSEYKEKK
jgi:hypothetical protein